MYRGVIELILFEEVERVSARSDVQVTRDVKCLVRNETRTLSKFRRVSCGASKREGRESRDLLRSEGKKGGRRLTVHDYAKGYVGSSVQLRRLGFKQFHRRRICRFSSDSINYQPLEIFLRFDRALRFSPSFPPRRFSFDGQREKGHRVGSREKVRGKTSRRGHARRKGESTARETDRMENPQMERTPFFDLGTLGPLLSFVEWNEGRGKEKTALCRMQFHGSTCASACCCPYPLAPKMTDEIRRTPHSGENADCSWAKFL